MAKAPKIGVFGLWHLGCVLSAAWSKQGLKVVGFDYDEALINKLSKAEPPIFEPNLKETLSKSLKMKTLSFSSDLRSLADCDFVFLAYDTPVLDDDGSDLRPLERALSDASEVLKDGALVIVSSQTPVGTCSKFLAQLQSEKESLSLVYSPENLRLGQAIENYLNPGRIILGASDERAKKKALSLFKRIPAKILSMNLESAEMVKHGINAFLASSIAFTNELSDLCESSGADILDVVAGMKSDPRIGEKAYLSPGIGFSGGTLGRDLKVLESLNISANGKGNLFKQILALSSSRKSSIVNRLKRLLGSLESRKVGILGLTYKPGTSTLRRSLPAEIVREILKEGAQLKVFDPKADLKGWSGPIQFSVAASGEEVIKSSEAVLILTEWPEFRKLDWKGARRESPQIVYDAKNCLVDLELGKKGYRYVRIGKKS